MSRWAAGRRIPEPLRLAHHAYARFRGFFWLPCPLCGRKFGGHEWRDIDGKPSSIPDPDPALSPGTLQGICPKCTRAGRGTDSIYLT